jgi:hypothetical protein
MPLSAQASPVDRSRHYGENQRPCCPVPGPQNINSCLLRAITVYNCKLLLPTVSGVLIEQLLAEGARVGGVGAREIARHRHIMVASCWSILNDLSGVGGHGAVVLNPDAKVVQTYSVIGLAALAAPDQDGTVTHVSLVVSQERIPLSDDASIAVTLPARFGGDIQACGIRLLCEVVHEGHVVRPDGGEAARFVAINHVALNMHIVWLAISRIPDDRHTIIAASNGVIVQDAAEIRPMGIVNRVRQRPFNRVVRNQVVGGAVSENAACATSENVIVNDFVTVLEERDALVIQGV